MNVVASAGDASNTWDMRPIAMLPLFALAALSPLACSDLPGDAADYELTPGRDPAGDPGGSGESDGTVPGRDDRQGGGNGAAACPFEAGAEAQKKVVFVDKYPDADLSIENETLRLIRAAVPGSRIRIAMLAWTRTTISNALVEAQERGVDIRALADRQNLVETPPGSGVFAYTDAVRIAKQGLGDDRMGLCNEDRPSGGACIGTGVNQNKLLLFSELCDGSKDVVVQSSANFTEAQLRAHNSALVVRDDPKLFELYESYWTDLAAQQTNLAYYRSGDGDTGTRAFFFPRAGDDENTDTVYRILEQVQCTSESRIRIAMGYWTMNRSRIVDILATKKAQGCSVKILTGEEGTSAALSSHLASRLAASDFIVAKGIHHKYLLVDAQYAGARQRLVWTGSHNYTGPALRQNDETLLRVDDANVFTAFQANWDAMWKSYSP
jgi:phosphatidylserine/phosphatidylglycerophosphate/cardiolipin synthase-like enzyme